MMLTSCLMLVCVAMSSVWARPSHLQARGQMVSHDSLNPILENLPDDNFGNAIRMFKPYMFNNGGCQVYTAVDLDGNWSGGLHDSGAIDGKCTDPTKGQIYARGAPYNGVYAIMYAWYWPKDQAVAGPAGGHRHDWENVVVWIRDPDVPDPQFLGAAASFHGGYHHNPDPPRDGTHPTIQHYSNGITDFTLDWTDVKGSDYNLVWWDDLPPAAKDTLNKADFGSANVPFKDTGDAFTNGLKGAWVDEIAGML